MKVSIRSDLSFVVKNDLNFSVQICTYCGVRYSIEIAEWELSSKRVLKVSKTTENHNGEASV